MRNKAILWRRVGKKTHVQPKAHYGRGYTAVGDTLLGVLFKIPQRIVNTKEMTEIILKRLRS